jgi:peptidyl-prolyl cis-trans isomerase C
VAGSENRAGWTGRIAEAARGRVRWVPRGRITRLVAVVAGALVLAGAAGQSVYVWATALPQDAVLSVHGDVLNQDQFQQRIKQLHALYGVQQPQGGPQEHKFKKDAAKSLAVSMVLDDAAKARNIVIPDKKAQDTLDKIIQQQSPDNPNGFTDFLQKQGLSENNVRDEVKRQLATSALYGQITQGTPPVTDQDVRRSFDARRAEMATPERRHLRNIVVATQQQADQLVQQARGGADFGALASANSQDSSTRGQGGDLGTVSIDQLDKTFAAAAFKAAPNTVFGPVKSQYGWNVGQVAGVAPGQPLSFDQVKQQLKADLENKRKTGKWRTWLVTQIENADVRYADGYRPDNPEAPPV